MSALIGFFLAVIIAAFGFWTALQVFAAGCFVLACIGLAIPKNPKPPAS